jgi:Tol biopolymer transport system component
VNAASGEATGAPVQIANHQDTRDYQYSLRYPTWAPDGGHVAYYLAVYQKKGGGWSFKGYEVYRVQATAGGTPQYLGAGLNPEWSPAVF